MTDLHDGADAADPVVEEGAVGSLRPPGAPGELGMPEAERLRLEARKRALYQVAVGFGVIVTIVSWVTREPGDVIVARGYPLVGVALLGFLAALRTPRVRLWPLEVVMFTSIGALILGRLFWHLHLSGFGLDERLLVLAGAHYWSLGVVIVGAFVMLDRRGGVIGGVSVLVLSAAMVGAAVLREVEATGSLPTASVLYLVRVHGFLGLLLALVTAVAGMREQLHRALARVEVLDERATTDPTTGLANRWVAQEALVRARAGSRRTGRPVSVVMMDLDRFKEVNDRFGHAVGDDVLREVGEALATEAREADLVARWGGEEFLLVLPNTHLHEAVGLAERCRVAVAAAEPAGVPMTATFGVAELTPEEDLDTLLRRADRVLYQAKDAGRDQVAEATWVG